MGAGGQPSIVGRRQWAACRDGSDALKHGQALLEAAIRATASTYPSIAWTTCTVLSNARASVHTDKKTFPLALYTVAWPGNRSQSVSWASNPWPAKPRL